jgi:hypothetical protein
MGRCAQAVGFDHESVEPLLRIGMPAAQPHTHIPCSAFSVHWTYGAVRSARIEQVQRAAVHCSLGMSCIVCEPCGGVWWCVVVRGGAWRCVAVRGGADEM